MNFIKNNIKKILFIVITFILIVLLGLSSIDRLNSKSGILGNIFSGLQKVTYNIGQTLTNSFYSVQKITKIKEENIMLTQNLNELQQRVRLLENIVNKSDALKDEYELKLNLKYEYVIGQVIALDDSNWFSRITIDKGTNDGLKVNDIVINAVETESGVVRMGLIGIITETNSNWSKVVTLLDETCKISFKDINNEESGILEGNIGGVVTGYFFDGKVNASKNDILVTSGIGEIYISDIYIGEIEDIVQTTDAANQRIIVNTAVDFTKLHKIFVLKIKR